jgi:hypothetical protein
MATIEKQKNLKMASATQISINASYKKCVDTYKEMRERVVSMANHGENDLNYAQMLLQFSM